MKLPVLLSVPHAGLRVPEEAEGYCILTPRQIEEDGDEGAREIYDLADHVAAFVTTDVARAIVDMNRAESDRRRDGVVKTHTCWNVPVYDPPLPEERAEVLIARYHRPYHARLREHAAAGRLLLGLDCHTMAAFGPPVGPDPGVERPAICLGNAGITCPQELLERFARCFEESFGLPVSLNHPFKGGYIIRTHAGALPWIQVELSRGPFLTNAEKRERFAQALHRFCDGDSRRAWIGRSQDYR